MPDKSLSSVTDPSPSNDWQASLAEFAFTRVALMKHESREAGQLAAAKISQGIICGLFALFSWLCLIAGAIGALHHFTGVSWWLATLGFALLHAIVALCFLRKLRQKSAPLFPVTQAEFEKDRLWMQNLKTPKS